MLKAGAGTGLFDGHGREIRIGDVARRYVSNREVIESGHGSWIEYRVQSSGGLPALVPFRCESGSRVSVPVIKLCDLYAHGDKVPVGDLVGLRVA